MRLRALLSAGLACAGGLGGAEGACYGYSYGVTSSSGGFSYIAKLAQQLGCPASSLNLTRLYVQGACVQTRDNSFGSTFPNCGNGGAVLDDRNATCERVFASGPAGAFVTAGAGDAFDSGSVCGTGKTAYSFVKSDCPNLTQASLALQISSFNDGWCFGELGRSFSKGVVVGVCVLVFVVVFCSCFALLLAIRKRKRQQGQPAVISMQPMGNVGGGLQNPYHSGPSPYGSGFQGGNPYSSGPHR